MEPWRLRGDTPNMITYEVTATGSKGFQVTAVSSESHAVIVEDFSTEVAAKAFAARMRQIDADEAHQSLGTESS